MRTLTRWDFWTFKVVHAVLGGLLTVTGACGGIFVTEQIRKQIAEIDSSIADSARRVDAIERALYQFQLLQTQGVLLGALRRAMACARSFDAHLCSRDFLCEGPTAPMIQELNSNDLAAFRREREEHAKLVEAALPADDKAAWNALLKFEMDREGRLRDLQSKFLDMRYALAARRRELDGWLNSVTVWGFILQQLRFVIVLLAGLVHQHGGRADITAT